MTAVLDRPQTRAQPRAHRSYWQNYRHNLWLLTVRDLKLRYTVSALGWVWSVVDPLLMALIYYVVFTFIFHRGGASEEPYIVFILTGLLPWTWFTGNLGDASKAFRQEAKLIRSVKIPRTIWVLRQILSKGIEYLISLPVLAFFALILWKSPAPLTPVYMVIAIVLQIVLTTGINFIIAPLSVFFRDLERIVRLATRLLFYGSPVLYSLDIGHPTLHLVYGFNPMAGVLELYRACFFPDTLDWLYVWQAALVSAVIFGIGCVVFRRTVPTVLKEI